MAVTAPGGLIRPEPSLVAPSREAHAKVPPADVAAWLQEGETVLITDRYPTGLAILAALRKRLAPETASTHQDSRRFRSAFREAAHNLLAPIRSQSIDLRKAPEIGWLSRLYPEIDAFLLPFSELQGLNSSWQWYTRGIQLPVLEHPLYPFHGVYFPTRFEHLILFDDWLRHASMEIGKAVDVGTGCGALTFQLLNHGAKKVYATDNNPNAIESVREDLARRKVVERVQLAEGDLFAGVEESMDLIVFNPPWIPGPAGGLLDRAVYYPPDLFPRFFEAAARRLAPKGRLVLLFSTLGRQIDPDAPHPIEAELAEGGRFQQISRTTQPVAPASKRTKRAASHRGDERVELWELGLIPSSPPQA